MYRTKIIFLYLLCFTKINSVEHGKTVRIYQFKGKCPQHENAPMYYSDIQIANVNRMFLVSMKSHIMKDMDSNLKLWLFLSRCSSRDALDSCETYNTIKINNFCRLLNAQNTPWAAFVEQSKPPMKCPLKKGVYETKNSTFDGSAFSHFPVMNWYWRIVVNIRDQVTGEILLCASLEAQIAPL